MLTGCVADLSGLPDIGLSPYFHQTGRFSVRGKLLFESNVFLPLLSSFQSKCFLVLSFSSFSPTTESISVHLPISPFLGFTLMF